MSSSRRSGHPIGPQPSKPPPPDAAAVTAQGQAVMRRQRASWTELFFDLVFVVTIAQLAHHLEGNPGLTDFGEFVVRFAAPWWAWLQFTAFTTQFGTADTARGRLLMLAAMA